MCLHKFVMSVTNSVPARKFYIEQMFVLVRMQFHKHVDMLWLKIIVLGTHNILR